MSNAIVHLCRHGQVDNPRGILYGRLPDFHLSPLGREMAARLGEYFAGRRIDHLRCSPLERARETMEPIAAGRPVAIDDRLIEALNRLQGRVVNGRRTALLDPRVWPLLVNPFRPSWGEPYVAQVARMDAALRDAARAAQEAGGDGGVAVVVSHQLPIWVTRLAAEGRRLAHLPTGRQCTLASVTSFRVGDDGISFVGYDEPCRDLLPPNQRKGFVAGA